MEGPGYPYHGTYQFPDYCLFGTAGNVIFASLAAYAISKHKFPRATFSWA